MSTPVKLINSAIIFFPSAFDQSTGNLNLFISGTGNISSGVMPMFLLAKERAANSLSLFMSANSKTSSWESLGNIWQTYDIACDVSASYFCNDWEYIPYSSAGATGVNKYISMFTSGSYRSARNYQIPLFMSCTGGGVLNKTVNLFLHAKNNDTKISGYTDMFVFGHEISQSSATLFTSGTMPSSSGSLNLFCNSYDQTQSSIKLFTSGI